MIELKDVIHYYLGCIVMTAPYGGQPNRKVEGMIVGARLHVVDVKIAEWQSITALELYQVKPILRRLEDMTEEEGLEMAKLQHDPKRHDKIDVLYIKSDHLHYIDGTMCGGDGWSEYNEFFVYFNQLRAQQFDYLIKKQFDLFFLLETDQAIDAKTINNGTI